MLPIGSRRPVARPPVVTLVALGILLAMWLILMAWPGETFVSGPSDTAKLDSRTAAALQLGLIPCELTRGERLSEPEVFAVVEDGLASCASTGVGTPFTQRPHPWFTVLTALFVHASIVHLIGNAWFLWLFGRVVEDATGHMSLPRRTRCAH